VDPPELRGVSSGFFKHRVDDRHLSAYLVASSSLRRRAWRWMLGRRRPGVILGIGMSDAAEPSLV